MTALISTVKQNIEHIKSKGNIKVFPMDKTIFAQMFAFKHVNMDIRTTATISGRPNRIADGAHFEYLASRINLDLANMPIKMCIERLENGIYDALKRRHDDREYLWMALGMAEALEDIAINRKRALRRQGIDTDKMAHIADYYIRTVCCLLFNIDRIDIYSA